MNRLFDQPITPGDFTDGRPGDTLSALSDDAFWTELERQLNQQKADLSGVQHQWPESLLLIHSPTVAASGMRRLQRRLQEAEARLADLTPPPGRGIGA